MTTWLEEIGAVAPEASNWLDAIEQRAANATPGPWQHAGGKSTRVHYEDDGLICDTRTAYGDAAFIAAARTDVPALLSTIRVLKEALVELQESADQMVFGGHGGVYLPMQQLRWQRADSSTKQLLSRLERGPIL